MKKIISIWLVMCFLFMALPTIEADENEQCFFGKPDYWFCYIWISTIDGDLYNQPPFWFFDLNDTSAFVSHGIFNLKFEFYTKGMFIPLGKPYYDNDGEYRSIKTNCLVLWVE